MITEQIDEYAVVGIKSSPTPVTLIAVFALFAVIFLAANASDHASTTQENLGACGLPNDLCALYEKAVTQCATSAGSTANEVSSDGVQNVNATPSATMTLTGQCAGAPVDC